MSLFSGVCDMMLVMEFGRFVQRPCPPQPPRTQTRRHLPRHLPLCFTDGVGVSCVRMEPWEVGYGLRVEIASLAWYVQQRSLLLYRDAETLETLLRIIMNYIYIDLSLNYQVFIVSDDMQLLQTASLWHVFCLQFFRLLSYAFL